MIRLTPREILSKHWGFPSFRPLQEDIIHEALEGRDVIALLPTGGGKSICYQVPALCKEGIAIVVSPLIALMHDQVDHLNSKEIKSIAITSGMSKREIDIALDNAIYGKYKFLYVSPERLKTDIFLGRYPKMNINLIAVDESHCISQWGYDFRPSYLDIYQLRDLKPNVPIMAVTATATEHVIGDIQERLHLKSPTIIKGSYERKNLAYKVIGTDNKIRSLMQCMDGLKGSGIVYVGSRKKTREISEILNAQGIRSDYYHAGLEPARRSEKQKKWLKGAFQVMVATNAFGMGIDKGNVRVVAHMQMPDSPEAYVQEAGRAGRDGKVSQAVLMYHPLDREDMARRLENNFPPLDEIKRVYQCLGNYFQLAEGAGMGTTHLFPIGTFCERYNLNTLRAYNCVKLLEKEGYIELTEAVFTPSRIHFTCDKHTLYNFQLTHPKLDPFIKFLLRTYDGLFNQFVKINEVDISKRSRYNLSDVIKMLDQLQQFDVLEYHRQHSNAEITWTTDRLPPHHVSFVRSNYASLKEKSKMRAEAMMGYASAADRCRNQMLLAYFGEDTDEPCGQCDYCEKQPAHGSSALSTNKIEARLRTFLESGSRPLGEVLQQFKDYPEDQVIEIIRLLVDHDILDLSTNNELTWK